MAPTVIFVPGFWEGPRVFDTVASQLSVTGLETDIVTLPSTGTKFPGNPSMNDDIAAIRKLVESHVDQEKEVLLVCHSAGGFLGSNAIKELEVKNRVALGKKGGVYKIVFLAGAVFPEGFEHQRLPSGEYHDDGGMTCKSPKELLMHDVPEPDEWLALLGVQPAAGWGESVTYAGWQHVPSVYVVAKQDKVIPPELQQQLASLAGSELKEVDAGHMLQLAKPNEVAAIIQEAAARGAIA